MDSKMVELAIKNLEIGLYKYEGLISKLRIVNVAEDMNFQREYNGFFKKQRRTLEFYSFYFSLLETAKNSEIDFSKILIKIHTETNRVEASFSSKMLSMIDPNFPVWDKYVLQNLGLKAPYTYSNNRIDKVIDLYNEIIDWYKNFIKTPEALEMINKFNIKYPMSKISNVKKIDLILWQMR